MKTFIYAAVLGITFPAVSAIAADTSVQPAVAASKPVYSIWAFQLVKGQWVKTDQYSWNTDDPQAALEYAAKVNAVPGWTTTSNLPTSTAVAGGGVRRSRGHTAGLGNGLGVTISADGRTISLPYMTVRLPSNINLNNMPNSSGSSFYDNTSTYGDTTDIQNMINTQDMINTQMMNNNIQDMINTQNFINTENMINSQNEANAAQNLTPPQNP